MYGGFEEMTTNSTRYIGSFPFSIPKLYKYKIWEFVYILTPTDFLKLQNRQSNSPASFGALFFI